jgi:hypothetical protein
MNRAVSVWNNGRQIYRGSPKTNLGLVLHPRSGALRKRQGLSGPLSDAFYESFLVVLGTQASEAELEAARREADAIRAFGSRGARYWTPMKKDSEVTSEDISRYHLIPVGTARSNSWINKINSKLPIRIEDDAVIAGNRRFSGRDVGLRMIYPNPLNPRKYVVICAGGAPKG